VIAQIATPEILYRQPVDAALARFVGEAVILEGTVRGGVAACALGRLSIAHPAADGPASVMVRPEQIRFLARPNADTPRAKVLAVTFYGHDASVLLELETRAQRVVSRVPGYRAPKPGEDVRLTVEGTVMAYPQAEGDAAFVNSDLCEIAQFPKEPTSAEAFKIKEDLP
jgi:iron(III) transport system ATP-binding protein